MSVMIIVSPAMGAINGGLAQTGTALEQVTSGLVSWRTLFIFCAAFAIAILAGRIIASLLRRASRHIGGMADTALDPARASKLRRSETIIVLSIAVIRAFLIVFALYFAWILVHPNQQPTAIIGASAVFVVLAGATLGPLLRDVAAGSAMMAEQWYGVGDHVSFEPFDNLKGVVERVTLRSTKIRGLSGEIIWINNQAIQAVRITPKGIKRIAIDVFVNDAVAGKKLINHVSKHLPTGKLMLASRLKIIETEKLSSKLWRITAIGETPPGREWLLENFALDMLRDADKNNAESIIIHGPISRFADLGAEQKFARAIRKH